MIAAENHGVQADHFPAGTLAYVGWAGKTTAMDESMLGQLLKEPGVTKAFKAMMSIHETALEGSDATDAATGETDGIPDVKLGALDALRGVVKFPVRIKCATLAWNTLAQGLDDARAENA